MDSLAKMIMGDIMSSKSLPYPQALDEVLKQMEHYSAIYPDEILLEIHGAVITEIGIVHYYFANNIVKCMHSIYHGGNCDPWADQWENEDTPKANSWLVRGYK